MQRCRYFSREKCSVLQSSTDRPQARGCFRHYCYVEVHGSGIIVMLRYMLHYCYAEVNASGIIVLLRYMLQALLLC